MEFKIQNRNSKKKGSKDFKINNKKKKFANNLIIMPKILID